MSRFVLLTLTLLLLLSFNKPTIGTEENDELEELIAIDEEEQETQHQQPKNPQSDQQKEAEILSKAQRIVLELNSDNAQKVIEDNEYVLMLGYAPWCARSAELMPRFAAAANVLKELGSRVLMAKVDAERYPKVASLFGIKGFPTLLLFANGSSESYTGGFEREDIVIWARKKTGDPVIRINSITEAKEFLKKHHTFVLGLFEKFKGPGYGEFVKAATSDNEIQFVEAKKVEVAKVLFPNIKSTKSFIGLVKSEPERYSTYDGILEANQILEFLNHNKFPLVTKLTELNAVRVYSSPIKLQVIVFANADDYRSLIEPLQEIARKFRSKIMFIYIDLADENQAKPFLTLFGLEDSENTVVAAFDNNMNTKYLLESDPTPSNIEDFCTRLQDGGMSQYFKSQPIPDNNDAAIKIVVGKTFDEMVLSNPKNVLLEVHTPWCISCETTSKQVEKLAKHFKGLDTLVFARIDASANEHPKLQEIEDYPTLLFYPANDKSNPIKLPTKSSAKDLAIMINKQLKTKENTVKDEL